MDAYIEKKSKHLFREELHRNDKILSELFSKP
jgi:hypothetical protein